MQRPGSLPRRVICAPCRCVIAWTRLRPNPLPVLERLASEQPIQGVIQPEDLTGAAVFFASDEARYVTGQILVISGGRHMP